jgi:hypothetical protein
MTYMASYVDPELTAIRIVREAVTDDTTTDPGYSYTEAVHHHMLAVTQQHGPEGVTAVATALGRMVQVALLSPKKRPENLHRVLDGFERELGEQREYDQDPES